MTASQGDYTASSDASRKIVHQHRAAQSRPSASSRASGSAAGHFSAWVTDAVDVLQLCSGDGGERATDAMREQLMERDQ